MTFSKKPERLFCDSEPIFKKLTSCGKIPADISVYTRSIAISQNPKIRSVYLDDRLSISDRQSFKSRIPILEKKLMEKKAFFELPDSKKYIFLQCFNSFQANILDAILLGQDADYDGPVTIVIPKTGVSIIDEVVRPCWVDMLSPGSNVSLLSVNIPYHDERSPRGNTQANIAKRLRFGGLDAVLWRVLQAGWLPSKFAKTGKVAVVGQNEMLREAVNSCFFHGAAPIFVKKPIISNSSETLDYAAAKSIIVACGSIVENRFDCIPSAYLRKKMAKLFLEKLALEMGQYNNLLQKWIELLGTMPKVKFLLSGYTKGPFAQAMADACRVKGIKVIAFQHGITREFLSNVEERSIFFETTFCDLFFAMNPISREVTSNYSANMKHEVITSNWPKPYIKISNQTNKSSRSILFVSTNLYAGHRPNGVPAASDRLLCELESCLVEKVFGQVKKSIDYKPYPAVRYLDGDPVLKAVNSQKNMSVVGTHEDLRYILARYQMFITTRATSTLSWIVATNKPFIFIDHFCHARLSDAGRDAFQDAFFLFDQSKPEFQNNLRAFLHRTPAEIYEEWYAKLNRRREVIERFFSGNLLSGSQDPYYAINNYLRDDG